jgi:hypothetical protein
MARHKTEDSKTFERTISLELHEAWKNLARKKDQTAISEYAGFSVPVINRALLYGYVKTPEVTDLINKFFKERLEKEDKEAKELRALQNV